MESWRNRELSSHYLAIYIDGLFVKVKRDKVYREDCFYIIKGVKEDKKEIAGDLSYVFSPDDKNHTIDNALNRFENMKKKWEVKYPSLKRYLDNFDITPYLTFLEFDFRIRRMVYTTNWIEQFNRSCCRTLKVRGALS